MSNTNLKVEQQLKLHIESTQYKYEEAEKSKKVLIEKNKAQFEVNLNTM